MWAPPFVDPTRIDRALRSNSTMSARVELWSQGVMLSSAAPIATGVVTDQLGTNNQGIGVRRSLAMTAEPTPAWLRWLAMPSLEVRPFRGLWLGNSTQVECPLGRFPIRMPDRARPVTTLSWQVDDYYSRLQDADFTEPIMSVEGLVVQAISVLFVWLGLPAPNITATSLARAVPVLMSNTRHDAVVSFATSIGAEVFFDRMGVPQIADARTLGTPTGDVTDLVETLKRVQQWDKVYNVVAAYSSAQGVSFPTQRVSVINPFDPAYPMNLGSGWTPTRAGSGGYPDFRVYRFTSPQLTTPEQAYAAAATLLAKVSALGESYTFTGIPDPRIDAGDTIVGPTVDGVKSLLVSSVTHPLTPDVRQQITTIAGALVNSQAVVVVGAANVGVVCAASASTARVPVVFGFSAAATVTAVRAVVTVAALPPVVTGSSASTVAAVRALSTSAVTAPVVTGIQSSTAAAVRAVSTSASAAPVVTGANTSTVAAVRAVSAAAPGSPAVSGEVVITGTPASESSAAAAPVVTGANASAVAAVRALTTSTAAAPALAADTFIFGTGPATSTTAPGAASPSMARPTGPGIYAIENLTLPSGAWDVQPYQNGLLEAVNVVAGLAANGAGQRTLTLPEHVFQCNGFSGAGGATGFVGFLIPDNVGIVGSGPGTIFEVAPDTVTAGQRDTWEHFGGSGVTNGLNAMWFQNGPAGIQIGQFHLRGNQQRVGATGRDIYYNGLKIYNMSNGAVISDVKVSGIPGYWNGPPGETFGININGGGNTVLWRVEVDGRRWNDLSTRVGGAGIAMNSTTNITLHDCHTHHMFASHGVAMWQTTNVTTYNHVSEYNGVGVGGTGGDGLNCERTFNTTHNNPTVGFNSLAEMRYFAQTLGDAWDGDTSPHAVNNLVLSDGGTLDIIITGIQVYHPVLSGSPAPNWI